jgi:hypothetical protein
VKVVSLLPAATCGHVRESTFVAQTCSATVPSMCFSSQSLEYGGRVISMGLGRGRGRSRLPPGGSPDRLPGLLT